MAFPVAIIGLATSVVKFGLGLYNGSKDKWKAWRNVKNRRTLAAEREAERAREAHEIDADGARMSNDELLQDLERHNRGGGDS